MILFTMSKREKNWTKISKTKQKFKIEVKKFKLTGKFIVVWIFLHRVYSEFMFTVRKYTHTHTN
jgi:hypothetical protein